MSMRSDETRTPYFYYCLYYDAETGHVDDFDPRLMSALKESNVQDPELAQTAQVTFAAYFRGHYDELAAARHLPLWRALDDPPDRRRPVPGR
ncbi:MAG: hypothetical protein V8T01_06570 [Oscillospiraceae bacterium]